MASTKSFLLVRPCGGCQRERRRDVPTRTYRGTNGDWILSEVREERFSRSSKIARGLPRITIGCPTAVRYTTSPIYGWISGGYSTAISVSEAHHTYCRAPDEPSTPPACASQPCSLRMVGLLDQEAMEGRDYASAISRGITHTSRLWK